MGSGHMHDGRPLKPFTVISSDAGRGSADLMVIPPRWLLANREQTIGSTGFASSSHMVILDNGPEFVAAAVRDWLAELAVTTLFIEPGSPWENGYVESFNGKLRDEFLNGEIFYTLQEAQILIADWRRLYNGLRPHSSRGNRPPAPEMIVLPGFSLRDYAPPSSTQEVGLALT
jgi:putative transposase